MGALRSIVATVALAALVSGCTLPELPWHKAPPKPTVQSEPAPPPAPAVKAATLFPAADMHLTFAMADTGKQAARVEEDWLREGGAIAATQNGVLYAVWYLKDDGVWRTDPKGGGALLRYLPPDLKDGEYWKQTSGSSDVWFGLTEAKGACDAYKAAGAQEPCWRLQVVNRSEALTFLFAGGAGAVQADAVNGADPSQSYSKKLTGTRAAGLSPEDRKSVVSTCCGRTQEPAAVTPVTAEQFRQAADKVTPKPAS